MNYFKINYISELTSEFDEIGEIINSDEFRNLKNISFLGFLNKIFPFKKNTDYSRFDHSLGVAFLANEFCKQHSIQKEDTLYLVIACLLHDLGHLPFSHLSEKALKIDHKIRTSYLIKNGHQGKKTICLTTILKRNKIDCTKIINILKGKSDVGVFNSLIKECINLDTIDAINRSAYSLKLNPLDPIELIKNLEIHDNKLYFNKSNHKIFDKFWLLKSKVYEDYIYNSDNLIIESMFNRLLEKYLTLKEKRGPLDDFLSSDKTDDELLQDISELKNEDLDRFLEKITNGHKFQDLSVIEIHPRISEKEIIDISEMISKKLKNRYPSYKVFEKRRLRRFYIQNTIDFYQDSYLQDWQRFRYLIDYYFVIIGAFQEQIRNRRVVFYIPEIHLPKKVKRTLLTPDYCL